MRLLCKQCRRTERVAEHTTAIVALPDRHELWWTCRTCGSSETYPLSEFIVSIDKVVAYLIHLGCQQADLTDLDAELEHLTGGPA